MAMKRPIFCVLLALCFLAKPVSAKSSASRHAGFSDAQERYFGQKPPGKKAEIFAPDEITVEPHDSPIIAQDETWMILGPSEDGALYIMRNGKVFLAGNPLNFDISDILTALSESRSGGKAYFNGMAVSLSENRVYLQIWMDQDENFYLIEKAGESWTNPVSLGDEVNSFRIHWQATLALNENLYFGSNGILVSVFDGKTHLKPVPLKREDNSDLGGSTPYIAPDESYVLFCLNKDIHISYHLPNGRWTSPQNLGPNVNSEGLEHCPRISPNGKYLFFISTKIKGKQTVYWADSGFIEDLKPDRLKQPDGSGHRNPL